MKELEQFIRETKDALELKRALAVKLTLAGRSWADVMQELGVSRSFISKWRSQYKRDGVESLRIAYHGWGGYLDAEAKVSMLDWLKTQDQWDVKGLARELRRRYGIEYKSLQSYYRLLAQAGISWKKSQPRNPRKDLQQVLVRRAAIKKTAGLQRKNSGKRVGGAVCG